VAKREPRRGAGDDRAKFARAFVEGRIKGFEKDMAICLTETARKTNRGEKVTHAYFPALGSCCGTIEYLAGLYEGRLPDLGEQHWQSYAKKFLPGDVYDADRVHVLYKAFRHSIAHRGISSGIWVDKHDNAQGRRTTWTVNEKADGAAIEVVESRGTLITDSPWETPYTHRVHIRVGRLWRDVHASAGAYVTELVESKELLDNFYRCMEFLYPRDDSG
jgi:hypothetical protein